jgi:cytidylate kinase
VTVAIDGQAGTGKSTVARRVADDAGLFYLNSGNFYRAITWYALEQGVDPDQHTDVIRAAREITFQVVDSGIRVNDRHLTLELRGERIDERVAGISAIPGIREIVNAELRICAKSRDLIAEGRDMTTVVFPDADVRIYLDASIESRARRRFHEGDGRQSLEDVREAIAARDRIDATKPVGALKLDPSALYIDSSNLTIDQVCEIVLHAILSARTKSTTTGAIG